MMKQSIRILKAILVLGLAPLAHSADYAVSWLDLSAVDNGSNLTSGAIYNLGGYGDVRVTFNPVSPFPGSSSSFFRAQNPGLTGESVTSGADSYSLGVADGIAGNHNVADEPTVNYSITFDFLSGSLGAEQDFVLSVYGLGNYLTGSTTVTANVGGTLLGVYDNPSYGTPNFTGGVGSFSVTNSVAPFMTGYGNSDLALIRLDGAFSSFSLNVSQVEQDGIQFNLGLASPVPVPEPSGVIMIGLAAVTAILRRKRS